MANSVKEFKKEIKYILGEIIDEATFKKLINPKIKDDKIAAIIEEAIVSHDELLDKVNAGKKADNQKKYFKELYAEFEQSAKALVDKLNAIK